MIASGSYPDNRAAQEAWHAQGKSPAAIMQDLDGDKTLTLPCDFSSNTVRRVAWDLKLEPTDFTQFEALSLDIR